MERLTEFVSQSFESRQKLSLMNMIYNWPLDPKDKETFMRQLEGKTVSDSLDEKRDRDGLKMAQEDQPDELCTGEDRRRNSAGSNISKGGCSDQKEDLNLSAKKPPFRRGSHVLDVENLVAPRGYLDD